MLLVTPQASVSFLPNMIPGTPTYPAPAAFTPGPERWVSNQHETAPKAMCGSLATMGAPLTDFWGATTQLLLPMPSSGSPTTSPTASAPMRADGYEPVGTMLSSSASPVMNALRSGPLPSTRFANSGMAMMGRRPVRYQRNSCQMAAESTGDHASGS